MSIMDFFKNIWESFVGQLFTKAAQTTVARLAEGLADIAAEVVKEAMKGDFMTGQERRDVAFNAIKGRAMIEGQEFTGHAINIAIELALALIKEGAEKLGEQE